MARYIDPLFIMCIPGGPFDRKSDRMDDMLPPPYPNNLEVREVRDEDITTLLQEVSDSLVIYGTNVNRTDQFHNIANNNFKDIIGRSYYCHPSGYNLSSIDYNYDITEYLRHFTCINCEPGAWVEHLHSIQPTCSGVGIGKNWNVRTSRIDPIRFLPVNTSEATSDIVLHDTDSIVTNEILAGVIDIALNTTRIGYKKVIKNKRQLMENASDEELSMLQVDGLIYEEEIITLPGGNFVTKINDTTSEVAIRLIKKTATSFRNISLFKPATSDPITSELYLICKDFQGDNMVKVEDFTFKNWINGNNQAHLTKQITAIRGIAPEKLDLNYALFLMGIPGCIVD